MISQSFKSAHPALHLWYTLSGFNVVLLLAREMNRNLREITFPFSPHQYGIIQFIVKSGLHTTITLDLACVSEARLN